MKISRNKTQLQWILNTINFALGKEKKKKHCRLTDKILIGHKD